jgi:hypothetical protein
MTTRIDVNFRPKSYFGPERLEQYLISKVKGSVVRKKLKTLFKESRHSEIETLLAWADACFELTRWPLPDWSKLSGVPGRT